ncbi:MAG: hypothetical protein U0269_04310 [Polyangiales bacterium]
MSVAASLHEPTPHAAVVLSFGQITTAALGLYLLGGKKSRAAADWCRSHGISLRRDGKLLWARVDDVRRALEAQAAAPANDTTSVLARAKAAMQRR